MGPSPSPPPPPPPPLPPQSRPSPPPFHHFPSPSPEIAWLLNSDRETEIFTQALTRELSSCDGGMASSSSSAFPSASCFSPPTMSRNFSNSSDNRPWQISQQTCHASKALQQQQQNPNYHHQNRQQPQQEQQQVQVRPVSRMRFYTDGYSHLDRTSLQNESPLSNNSSPRLLPVSTETPPSLFSSVSANSAIASIARDRLIFDQSHSQHQDCQGGSSPQAMATFHKPQISPDYSGSSVSARASSMGLSAQADAGVGASIKVSKKRSRVSNKEPVSVLSTDASNFRAMVQQLTGIPSSPYSPATGITLLKPQPIMAHPLSSTLNLPTLDTSAGFLGPKYLKEGFSFMQKQHQGPIGLGSPFPGASFSGGLHVSSYGKQPTFNEQGSGIHQSLPSPFSGHTTILGTNSTGTTIANRPSNRQDERISVSIPSPGPLDSLPMDELLPLFDEPTLELARMA